MSRFFYLVLLILPVSLLGQGLPSIEEKTNGLKKYEGYLNYYWDDSSGKVWLEINKTDTELLYVISLPAAIGSNDIGLDRGLLGGSGRIISFNKVGNKLLLTEPNYNYRALTNDKAEQRAVKQSFAQSILWGFIVEASSNGHYLVDATDFLQRDAMMAANHLRSMNQGNYVTDKTRSAIYLPQCKNFPKNTELEATITLVNSDGITGQYLQNVTPSSEAITIRIHHSFVELPDADYKPRVLDPRSSFIDISFMDFSTPITEPIEKKFILRHRLQKKNPGAAKSEVVKPIIYYVDNGTPEPIRSALIEGAQWWSQAFEAAGFINAFQVKLLPADADPMDVRYNVINWVHRSTRGWSYGYSVIDPRTGEIIKGHVSLGSLRVRQDYLIAQGLLAPFEKGLPADDKMLTMALNRLKQLAAHEVGHTLGLMHNYSASVVNRSSVMDYPPPGVSLNAKGEIDISNAYAEGIGEWDKVSIKWGYGEIPRGKNENEELASILTTAFKKGLQFISDRDARAAGGLHPTAHLWDNGKDPVEALATAMKVRAVALKQFGEKNIRPGMPMAMLEDVLVPVYLYHRYQMEAVTKLVGGMYYTYTLRGDGQTITKALTKEEQLKALHAVLLTIEPSSLVLPEEIIKLIPPRPANYNYTAELFKKRTGLAFDALSPAETAAGLSLSFLLNTERMNRMVIYEVQNNGLGLSEMIKTIINSTWKADRKKGMEELIQLQTEQIVLTYLLAASVNSNNSFATQSTIQNALTDLKIFIEKQKSSDVLYAGHLLLATERMKKPEAAKPTLHAEVPPGSPIGCEQY